MIEKRPGQPDSRGHFGEFGGQFVSETLMHALDELREAYGRWRQDQKVLINLSGRGDKDVQTVAELEGMTL